MSKPSRANLFSLDIIPWEWLYIRVNAIRNQTMPVAFLKGNSMGKVSWRMDHSCGPQRLPCDDQRHADGSDIRIVFERRFKVESDEIFQQCCSIGNVIHGTVIKQESYESCDWAAVQIKSTRHTHSLCCIFPSSNQQSRRIHPNESQTRQQQRSPTGPWSTSIYWIHQRERWRLLQWRKSREERISLKQRGECLVCFRAVYSFPVRFQEGSAAWLLVALDALLGCRCRRAFEGVSRTIRDMVSLFVHVLVNLHLLTYLPRSRYLCIQDEASEQVYRQAWRCKT